MPSKSTFFLQLLNLSMYYVKQNETKLSIIILKINV